MVYRLVFGFIIFFYVQSASAAWLEASGKVLTINTYTHTEAIVVRLESAGAPVSACTDKWYFAISKSASAESRARMYSALLAAKMSGASVTLAFNDVGNCEAWDADANAYRRITRLKM